MKNMIKRCKLIDVNENEPKLIFIDVNKDVQALRGSFVTLLNN